MRTESLVASGAAAWDVVAIALTPTERELIRRAVEALVRCEGESASADNVLHMLDHALGERGLRALGEVHT